MEKQKLIVSEKDKQLYQFLVENMECLIALGPYIEDEDLFEIMPRQDTALYLDNLKMPAHLEHYLSSPALFKYKPIFAINNNTNPNGEDLSLWLKRAMAGAQLQLALKSDSVSNVVSRLTLTLASHRSDVEASKIEGYIHILFKFVIVLNRKHTGELVMDVYTLDKDGSEYVPCVMAEMREFPVDTFSISDKTLHTLRIKGNSPAQLKKLGLLKEDIATE